MMLEARALHYAYTPDAPVLRDVSLTLTPGEIVFLLGRNGCGKTTLLRCLSGLIQPQAGAVLLDARMIQDIAPAERARRVGLIPQFHHPAFAYTVREMVLMGRAPHLALWGSPGKADHAAADEALERVGMIAYRDRPYTTLSGGQQQLVLIARGLAQQCTFLLMDEPDAHLDPHNQHRIMTLVRELVGAALAFVVSSHTPTHALTYADRVLLMQDGRKLALGVPADTLTEPLLTAAYGMDTEIIYQQQGSQRIARAILPRRTPRHPPPERDAF